MAASGKQSDIYNSHDAWQDYSSDDFSPVTPAGTHTAPNDLQAQNTT